MNKSPKAEHEQILILLFQILLYLRTILNADTMNKNLQLFILLFVLFFSSPAKVNAQNNSDWQPIYLTPGGGNMVDSVEAFFQVNSCNGDGVVFIKFINHSSHLVKIEWYDGLFTQELKWIKKELPADEKSLTLPPKTTAEGGCINSANVAGNAGTVYPQLLVSLKNFSVDKNEIKRYSASRINIIASR